MAVESHIIADYFTGEDKTLNITVYQADGVTPQDCSSFTGLSWMVKRRKTDVDADALLVKTLAGGAIAVSGDDHDVCAITIAAADIADILADVQYYHELKRTDAPKTVISRGRFLLMQAVHRA